MECWDDGHTSIFTDGTNYGVCDCDGMCVGDGYEDYAGDHQQLCSRDTQKPIFCSECQAGCGGATSEECWDENHTSEDQLYGVCDCDGMCNHLYNEGDGEQTCHRDTPDPSSNPNPIYCFDCQAGCGGADSAECWNEGHTSGDEGICDCDGMCDHFDGYEGDGEQTCIRGDNYSPGCEHDESKCRTLFDDCFGATDEPRICADGYLPAVNWHEDKLLCFPLGCPAEDIGEEEQKNDCDLCAFECTLADECHGCVGDLCYSICVEVHGEDAINEYLQADCKKEDEIEPEQQCRDCSTMRTRNILFARLPCC